jgi:hypothetical protein
VIPQAAAVTSAKIHRRVDATATTVQEYLSGGANAPPSASFQEYNRDESFAQISAADNEYTSPDALTSPLITPPQSSEDTSLPLESSDDIDTVEEPREVDHKSDARKTRRKR